MDFGEILKLWDAKAGTPSAVDAVRGDGKDEPRERRLTKKDIDALPVDARLDLHGLTAAEAEDALASFFAAAERGVRDGGALVGLVSRYYSVGQLAAAKAVEILVQHRAPKDIPIETLKRFALIINMQVARKLQIYPPITMLNYAEIVTN